MPTVPGDMSSALSENVLRISAGNLESCLAASTKQLCHRTVAVGLLASLDSHVESLGRAATPLEEAFQLHMAGICFHSTNMASSRLAFRL